VQLPQPVGVVQRYRGADDRDAEQLTGRNLDSPRDRTELWLAFEARDVAATL
jgi:hypothetical protein